ncbi:hybrid sensor histidine kinase/response regulator [Desulfolithobacter sp.]
MTDTPAKRHRFLYSLRTKLQVMTLLVVLLPLVVVTIAVVNVLKQHLDEDIARQLYSDVSAATLFYQKELGRVQDAVHSISLDNTVKTTFYLGIKGQLKKHLETLGAQYNLDFLLIVTPLGRLTVSPYPGREMGHDFYEHPVIAEAALMSDYSATMLEENATLLHFLELKGRNVDNMPVLVMEAASPIVVRDKFVGIVFGGRMVSGNESFLEQVRIVAGCDRVELIAGNRVAGSSLDPEGRPGRWGFRFPASLDYQASRSAVFGSRILSSVDKEEQIYAYHPLEMPEESLAALVCFRNVSHFQPLLTRMWRLMISVFLGALVLALILTFFMSRFIATPLHHLTTAMRNVRKGGVFEPVPVCRDDEIGDLISGFNRMAGRLEQRIQDLHHEVVCRKEAEKELAAESERLRVTLESIADGVIATDTEGRVVIMNRVAEQLTGWNREEAMGRQVNEVCPVIDELTGHVLGNPVARIMETGQLTLTSGDLVLRARSGEEFLITESCAPLKDKDGTIVGAVLVFRDVTQRRRMEEELTKAQKLESIGVLAGGIAHDFNNLLTAILGNISLAKLDVDPGEQQYRNLEDAELASLRARDLTQQLLTFSRGGAPVKSKLYLNKLIEEVAGFTLRGSPVQPELHLAENLWPVHADGGQINQVFSNLLINAMQAMPSGGTIRISACNYTVQDDTSLPLRPGRYVQITVEDQGTGIPPEHLDRIFDPYFTTKEAGNGLGLAISYAIVNKHGGYILVDSVQGSGTIFYVYLPARLENEQADKNRDKQGQPAEGSGRILVMDDEDMVRSVVRSILSALGYSVECVADGEEAVRVYREAMESGNRFDALLLDLTIPGGMGGEETIRILRQIDPEVKGIVSSGYSSHPIMSRYRIYGFAGVVVKPYQMGELGRVLREVLSRT